MAQCLIHPWFPDWQGRKAYLEPVQWRRWRRHEFAIALFRFQRGADSNGNLGNFENRWFLLVRRVGEEDIAFIPVCNQTVITSSAGSTQTITSDASWTNNCNKVECIGAGADGTDGASTSTSGGGGGGGAYESIFNMSFTTPGTTQAFVRVGAHTPAGGTVGDSWLTQTSPGTSFPVSAQVGLGARGGAAITATSATGSAGGAAASGYANPATGAIAHSGGKGGNAGAANTRGGAGGGAAGDDADGVSPADSTSAAQPGGAGDGGTVNGGGAGGPAGNGSGANGGTGNNITATQGSGGGGGGGNASPSTGGAGGLYGGGGGGGGRSTGTGGTGAQGIVVLTWFPIFPQACI